MRRPQSKLFLFSALVVALGSCSDPPESTDGVQVCAPGATQTCLGPAACEGAQACNVDGMAWGACDCGAGAGGGSTGTGTATGGGAHGGAGGSGGVAGTGAGQGGNGGTGGAGANAGAGGDGGAAGAGGAASATLIWGKRFGDAALQRLRFLALDHLDRPILAGEFAGSIDLGGGGLLEQDGPLFLGSFDASGAHQWSESHGGGSAVTMAAAAADSEDNIYVVGEYTSPAELGGEQIGAADSKGGYLAKFSSTGSYLWSVALPVAQYAQMTAVVVDSDGAITVGGFFEGAFDCAGTPLVSAGSYDSVLAQFDSAGALLRCERYGSAGNERIQDLAADANGNVIVAGAFEGSIDLGSGLLSSVGSADIFLAQLDTTGTAAWAVRIGDSALQEGARIAVDGANAVLLAASFRGTVAPCGQGLYSPTTDSVLVARYSAAGTCNWATALPSSGGAWPADIAAGPANVVAVAGSFFEDIDLGAGVVPGAGAAGSDSYFVQLSETGAYLWGRTFGCIGSDSGAAVAVDSQGQTYVGGWMTCALDLGSGALPWAGASDIYLGPLSP